ncbi:MAG: 3'(2'),5'-bisphosphate nucleotidase CysQ [Rikenellaceae bacterium]|nr:3'(2'),5'-bisphosphate nucleotidase CysQ [Rikenellaceae bacterium]
MLNNEVREYLLAGVFNAAVKAGAAIMEIYARRDEYGVSYKSDHTPITEADCAAHKVIRESLGPTRIPILSEEGRELGYEERRNWEMFWLVDPLDGTIEFLKGNNEFTVNIALMENNRAIASVVYVPYLEKMYLAERGRAAWVKRNVKPTHDAAYTFDEIESDMQTLPLDGASARPLRVAVSRSHQTPETADHIEALRCNHPDLEVVEQGSSYKFCLLAEGTVDYYPRTTHTYEWDTAAGELILAEAGGETRSLPGGDVLQYNKENLQNPWFECRARGIRN